MTGGLHTFYGERYDDPFTVRIIGVVFIRWVGEIMTRQASADKPLALKNAIRRATTIPTERGVIMVIPFSESRTGVALLCCGSERLGSGCATCKQANGKRSLDRLRSMRISPLRTGYR